MFTRFIAFFTFVLAIIATASVTMLLVENGSAKNAPSTAAGLDKAAVESVVESYLKENPQVIVQAFLAARQAQMAEEGKAAEKAISTKRDELEGGKNVPVIGNPKGDVTIVEFYDYNCGYCKRVVPDIISLLEQDKNIKFVLRDFPILGPRSHINAKASLAVNALDSTKFLDFHTKMMQKTPQNDEQLFAIADEIGIKSATLKEEMAKPIYDEQVEANLSLGQAVGVSGTPAFIIDGELARGALGLEQFKQRVQAVRSKK